MTLAAGDLSRYEQVLILLAGCALVFLALAVAVGLQDWLYDRRERRALEAEERMRRQARLAEDERIAAGKRDLLSPSVEVVVNGDLAGLAETIEVIHGDAVSRPLRAW